jgi:glycosyltransferase involved in cell wall biosynthesis
VYHPDVLDWLNAQVPAKDRDMESLCQLFLETNSYCFMDLSNYLSTKRRVDLPWQERYAPVTVHTENTDKVQSVQPVPPVNPDKPLQVGWLGRLDNDKIHSMLNVAENLMKDSTVEKVDFHVIGDGNAKRHMSVANYSPKIRFILTSYLYAEERNNYIRDNVDIMVAMGISAIDTAMLGVPTVIPIVSPKPFWTDSFVYVQDLNKYSLGWNIEDDSNMGCITHSFHEVVEDIRNGKKLALGEEGRVFCGQTFSLSAASMELLKCLEETELTVAKCMAYPSVQKEMKTFDWYRRLRLCRDFPEFHEAVARMNRAKQKSFKQKFKTLLSKILKKLRGQ